MLVCFAVPVFCPASELMDELLPNTDIFIIYSTNIEHPEDLPSNSPVPIDNKDKVEIVPLFFPKLFRVIVIKITLVNVKKITVSLFQEHPNFITEIPIIVRMNV